MAHYLPFRPRNPGSGLPLSRRSLLKASLGGTMAAMMSTQAPVAAQRMDPFTFITSMEATTELGQAFGQPVSAVEPVATSEGTWTAYIQLPIKEGQDFSYTCEFDSSWIILRAHGHDMDLFQQLEIVGHDLSIEPYYQESRAGITIFGGDIDEMYSGDYRENLLARARANAMRTVFEHVGLSVTPAPDRATTETALLAGKPVYFKSTVDFLDWDQCTWLCPDGDEFPVVLTNDHALILMGFNDSHVIVRDPLGPTTTNTIRPWQYAVSWERYLQVIAAQGNDAIAVGPSRASYGDGTGG